MIFDIDNIGCDLGKYQPETGEIVIYLANIYDEFIRKFCVFEGYLLAKIIDVIIHEKIHEEIDKCLEGDPDDIDDHKIFKYLVGV